jgi:hypothetical protein
LSAPRSSGFAIGQYQRLAFLCVLYLPSFTREPNLKLPDADSAVVPRSKVEDYLLNLEHPIGRGKAKFFIHFGFRREAWETLAEALRRHAQESNVTEISTDADGQTYVIEGDIISPSGRRPRVRTIWMLKIGELAPRFITAYPLEA